MILQGRCIGIELFITLFLILELLWVISLLLLWISLMLLWGIVSTALYCMPINHLSQSLFICTFHPLDFIAVLEHYKRRVGFYVAQIDNFSGLIGIDFHEKCRVDIYGLFCHGCKDWANTFARWAPSCCEIYYHRHLGRSRILHSSIEIINRLYVVRASLILCRLWLLSILRTLAVALRGFVALLFV